ncbi:CheY-like chemotaxis protein [Caulobacter ginsengisoli]|uniref:CheY-like chemotaxis protein n=1 Tax=Caulobacter ginsengisoli TaxID=400775 RepID=A0ABU0IUY8_9CAUL|nr:response regulator [Caulobacter ginsengisoli]MDQ0465831.1 CheY-like chemotaxis protein [Caulobacter ginsengisoli]
MLTVLTSIAQGDDYGFLNLLAAGGLISAWMAVGPRRRALIMANRTWLLRIGLGGLTLAAVAWTICVVIGQPVLAARAAALVALTLLSGAALLTLDPQGSRAAMADLKTALDAAPSGIAFFDSQEKLYFWNQPYAAMLQTCGLQPVVGLTFPEIIAEAARQGRLLSEFALSVSPTPEGGLAVVMSRITDRRAPAMERQPPPTSVPDAPGIEPGEIVPVLSDLAEAPAADAGSRPLRVLAAEDNATNRLILAAVLEPLDLDLVMTEDGAEALEAFKLGNFDVVLMDIQMPRMNGVEATRAIRAFEAAQNRPATPILAVTANVMSQQVSDYLAAGMDDCIAKPIHAETLFQAIENALAPKPPSQVAA